MNRLHRPLSPHRQRGSAYILTLMALVVLTIAGLSLSLVTQTEQQLGANERSLQAVFYASDSGLALGTARTLAINDTTAFEVTLDKRTVGVANVANRIQISPFRQILPMPCNYCEINQGTQYFNVNHAINSNADRVIWQGDGAPPAGATVVGRSSVGAMIELQPWQVTLVDALDNSGDFQF